MIVRLGFLVAASIAAYAIKQHNVNPSRPREDDKARLKQQQGHGEEKEQVIYSTDGLKEEDGKEEEEEEVKLISSIINPAFSNTPYLEDDDILPEFEDLLSGEIDFPLPDKSDEAHKDVVYEIEMANNANELERLRRLVKELEEREVKLEGELLEYYGLKEQESDILELQRQLKIKTVEINMLNITINSLQAERKKLQEEISVGALAKKELDVARNKIKELQRQIQLEANQTKGQLLLLKQQVSTLKAKEEEAVNKDVDVEKKLKAVKELEVEVMELKRKNRELQHEKRELIVKLDGAEARAAKLSNMTESDMVAAAREEVNKLRHTNDDLLKQVEGLQMNRFSEVEELVYLRWVNACLRFELRNYQTPQGKISARDLSKSLSPRSQERAKQLMLEYAESERGQGDTDLESNFSHPSSPGSEDFDNASVDSSMSRYSSLSKKPSLIQKFKVGIFAPGRCSPWQQLNCTGGDSGTEPYLVSHHQLLAHAAAVKLYKDKYQVSQKGMIGITLVTQWMVPYSDAKHHQNAATRALDFMLGWFMDPLTNGDYPHTMRSLVGDRLPRFSRDQSSSLKGSFDFIGLNYYTANYAAYAPHFSTPSPSYMTDARVNLTTYRDGTPIGPRAASDWLYIYPRGIRDLLLYLKSKYHNPLIYITENGVDEFNNSTLPLDQQLADNVRIDFYHSHLSYLKRAIEDGANVKGYFAWSLLDNFEWSSGYTVRFGINYVDYRDGLKRHPKLSAAWFKGFLRRP